MWVFNLTKYHKNRYRFSVCGFILKRIVTSYHVCSTICNGYSEGTLKQFCLGLRSNISILTYKPGVKVPQPYQMFNITCRKESEAFVRYHLPTMNT